MTTRLRFLRNVLNNGRRRRSWRRGKSSSKPPTQQNSESTLTMVSSCTRARRRQRRTWPLGVTVITAPLDQDDRELQLLLAWQVAGDPKVTHAQPKRRNEKWELDSGPSEKSCRNSSETHTRPSKYSPDSCGSSLATWFNWTLLFLDSLRANLELSEFYKKWLFPCLSCNNWDSSVWSELHILRTPTDNNIK